MPKYVLKQDLPEVVVDGDLLCVNGENWAIEGVWETPARWREKALSYLAIAEHLDGLKPKLPTTPGSVILATKIKGWVASHPETFLSLTILGEWRPLAAWSAKALSPLDIEDWKPVQLTVVEVTP